MTEDGAEASREHQEWGTDLTNVTFNGVGFRVYAQRPVSVAELLGYADRWGDRPHIVQGSRVVTFAELRRLVSDKADRLRGLGISSGDRVLLMGFNSPDWVVNFWAIVSCGAVPVLANAWWSVEELKDALDLTEPKLVLADDRALERLPAGLATAPWPASSGAEESPSVRIETARVDENAPSVIIFTSGTSGRPKAVLLAHRSILSGLHMLLHITNRLPHQVAEHHGTTALHTGPMFHIGGIQTLSRAVILGDTLVMPGGRFEPGEAVELMEKWRISRWSAVPTMVSRVLEHPDVFTRDLRSLRSLTVGGAPITGDFLAKLKAGFPGAEPRVATGYGLTENGGQATAASGVDTTERPGTSGRPLPCAEIRIAPAQAGQDGEILVRSPTQMLGYVGEAASPVDEDGWLHTGDLGVLDKNGYLWITGRSKDLIIRGGENIAPAAVEEALNSFPGVVESAVFGVPNADLGEEVMAVVSVAGGVTTDHLREHLAGRVASFAIPRHWQLVHDVLPVNHSGKIDKPEIARSARADLASRLAQNGPIA